MSLPNNGLELANPDAAQGVLRPPSLLSGLAAQAGVGQTEENGGEARVYLVEI